MCFDEPCLARYIVPDSRDGNAVILEIWNDESVEYTPKAAILAPLYQQAFRWFREKHDLHIPINKVVGNDKFVTWSITGSPWNSLETYRIAELESLKQHIEIVNDKRQKTV